MDSRYFWIKDRLRTENIDLQCCPASKMIADFFTKPMHGNVFYKFRDVVLRHKTFSEADDVEENCENNFAQDRVRNSGSVKTVKSAQSRSSQLGPVNNKKHILDRHSKR